MDSRDILNSAVLACEIYIKGCVSGSVLFVFMYNQIDRVDMKMNMKQYVSCFDW